MSCKGVIDGIKYEAMSGSSTTVDHARCKREEVSQEVSHA